MTEFKGTKGKWVVGIVPEYNDTLKSAMLEVQSDYYWVCKVQNNGMIQSEEGNANALLISKAPEMLKMLREFLAINGGCIQDVVKHKIKVAKLIKEATEI